MSFKFTFLGLEYCSDKNTDKEEKMPKKRKTTKRKSSSKKSSNHRAKFTKAVQHCHKVTKGRKSFGKCMRKRLKK